LQLPPLISASRPMLQSIASGLPAENVQLRNDLPKDYPVVNYDAHARTVAADAYWKQVKRTINGEPVDEAQILLIVDAITNALSLQPRDVVLDLACGNGALSSYLFDKCGGLIGVDISPYLIDVARRDFARVPNYIFRVNDARSYVTQELETGSLTKGLFYGAFQYLPRSDASLVLKALSERFPAMAKVFIGNLPNRRLADRFYRNRAPTEAELNDPGAQIGVWYLPEELEALAQATGWRARLSYMPALFYGAKYRFDVTLERRRS
jgi:SAM-dependent methyltransferase